MTYTREQVNALISSTRVKSVSGEGVANTPAYCKTVLSALSIAYEHLHGTADTDDFGDLGWLTLEALKRPSKSTGAPSPTSFSECSTSSSVIDELVDCISNRTPPPRIWDSNR